MGRVSLPSTAGSIQLVFEGVIGTSFLSDIALDDIRLRQGSCGGNTIGKEEVFDLTCTLT
jgi:hypothetical protein